jgi:hypothetical protein
MTSLNAGPSMTAYISADPNLIPDGFKVASLFYLVLIYVISNVRDRRVPPSMNLRSSSARVELNPIMLRPNGYVVISFEIRLVVLLVSGITPKVHGH